jgi:hypothetical protein
MNPPRGLGVRCLNLKDNLRGKLDVTTIQRVRPGGSAILEFVFTTKDIVFLRFSFRASEAMSSKGRIISRVTAGRN